MSDLPDVTINWMGRILPEGKKPPREKGSAQLDRTGRRWAVLGGVSAALLIGLVFVVGLGLVILLLLLAWGGR